MSKAGKWEEMGEAIDDELLDAFAVVGDPDAVAKGIVERWGGTYDRISLYTPYPIDTETLLRVIADVRSGS
jgi:alkanesulfonate monooxygenase SsuD/methylene tetrahydromethanopterin reductase-like flavin-dependent oxidoreductase (luciferase family)